jgi:uncharacterized protein YfaS (alpha-2-macroglobulin family)
MKIKSAYLTFFYALMLIVLLPSCNKFSRKNGSIMTFSESIAESGRPIPELSGYRIVYYEPAMNKESAGAAIQESDAPFVITDYGPRDELPKEIRNPSIYVVFSQPVVPLAKLGDPIRENAELFKINPPLKGVYRWYGTKLLSFEPDVEFIPQRRYTITVSDAIKSLGGKTLQGEKSFSFETEQLSVLSWSLGGGEHWVDSSNAQPNDAKLINVTFSYPVDIGEISKWLEVNAAGRNRPFAVSYNEALSPNSGEIKKEQKVLITIKEDLPLDTDVIWILKEGARSKSDMLGAKYSQSWSYHTLRAFRFDDAYARSWARSRWEESYSIPISLSFNQSLDSENAYKYINVEGFPVLKSDNVSVYGSTVEIRNLPLQYQNTYYVNISADIKDLYGRALGKAVRAEVSTGMASSYVSIKDWGSRMLEAAYPPKIVWEAQNPVSLRTAVSAVDDPYGTVSAQNFQDIDVSKLPANLNRFFIEDLSPFMNAGGKGSVALRWEYSTRYSWDRERISSDSTWLTVQVTNIGLTVRYAYNMTLVWATHLSDGTPVVNADVELMQGRYAVIAGKTDSQGLAVFNFKGGDFSSKFTPGEMYSGEGPKGYRIRVTEGNTQDKVEFVPNDSHNLWRFGIYPSVNPFSVENTRPVTFLFTDRGLYRPGETVTFRGIDRNLYLGDYDAYQGQYFIEVSTGGYRAPVIASLNGNTTVNGGSFGSFTLPDKIDPGQYQIVYRRDRSNNYERRTIVNFTVANFERLRFESSLKFTDNICYQGDKLNALLSASWLSGGELSGAPYTWFATRESLRFIPGNDTWNNWHFGPEINDSRSYLGSGEGALEPDGKATISISTDSSNMEGAAYRYQIEAGVQDAARQEIASRASVTVHPASFYIAARIDSGTLKSSANANNPPAYFLSANNPATLSWTLVSPDGEAWSSSGGLSLQLVYHEWKQAKQSGIGGNINLVWEKVEEIIEERSINYDAPRNKNFISGVFHFTPKKSGLWEIRLQGKDQQNRITATRFRFYVSGAGWVRWGSDDVDAVSLSTEKSSYTTGETAKILVRSPLEKGKYLLTLEREGIISQQLIDINGSVQTIEIPIQEWYLPVVYAVISSYTVRSGAPQHTYYEPDLDKPKGIFGVTPIYVSSESRNYQIEINPVKAVYRPADEAEVKLTVKLNGKPAPRTEVSFMAVDRGVVDLINYHVPDPVAFFYDPYHFPLAVRGADSRSLLIDPVTYNLSDLQGGDSENDDEKVNERKDFRPTAVFEPYLVTGNDGTVTVKFKLPDSLTTYRCTAVAAGVHNFGIQEKDLRVSAPLTAVAALPRKLRWRDTGTVSLILTNLENTTTEAKVSLATSIAPNTTSLWDTVLEVDGDAEKTVKILPGASAEVRFLVAALGVGEAQLAFTLNSPAVKERIIKTILVDRPVLTETVTTIGNLGGSDTFIEEGFVLPSIVPEGTGNVAVNFSTSRLASLKEAVRYLLEYPYGCLEQRTARLLPIVAFGEYLDAFDIDSPLRKDGRWNPRLIAEDELAFIAKSQFGDGSFPYWPGGASSDMFVSLRIAHIVALASAKGWKVPDSLSTQKLISWIASTADNDSTYQDPMLKGYSLWIRTMYGQKLSAEISGFLKRGDELGISGWALAGLAALELGQRDLAISARDRVRRYIRPGTRSLDLTDTYERSGYWSYETDRYALALMLFQSLSPEDDMTTRLATSLIERQRRGTWGNTVSSFWATLAFGMTGDIESAAWKSPGFQPLNAKALLGGVQLVNARFAEYGGSPVSYNAPFTEKLIEALPRDTLLPLRIEREGTPRLYYTASLRYGIPTELASARDEGLCVFAETLDSDGKPVKNGRLKAGKTYTRRIILSSSHDRTFVALRAPIPSGAEIIDSTFVTSLSAPERLHDDWRSIRFIMDDEVRYHWNFLQAGRQEIEYRFRAVMPGIYPTPPASAECMYEEEIFGRSAGELIRIE